MVSDTLKTINVHARNGEITLAVIGSRGAVKAVESLSFKQALALNADLQNAIAELAANTRE